LLPLGESWEIHAFTISPGGIAAAVGAVVAGYAIGPLVESRPSALGTVALRFGLVMWLAALPLVALDSAILASRPLEEPWPVTLGPFGAIVFGPIMESPLLIAVSAVAALVWTLGVRVVIAWPRGTHVTFTDAD
jgi:hypothetical protein